MTGAIIFKYAQNYRDYMEIYFNNEQFAESSQR
jgi:hypothetical protein